MKFTKTTICLNVYNPVFDRWERYIFVFVSVANPRTRFWRLVETKGAGHGIAKSIRENCDSWHRVSVGISLREFLLKEFTKTLQETIAASWEALTETEQLIKLQGRPIVSNMEVTLRESPYLLWISIERTSRPAPLCRVIFYY